MGTLEIACAVSAGLAAILILACGVLYSRYSSVMKKYAGVVDADAALERARAEAKQLTVETATLKEEKARELTALDERYRAAKATFEALSHEVSLVEENLEDISFGLYKPHFDYQTSDAYRAALERVRGLQKELIKGGRAATFQNSWSVGGSRSEGERMQKQYVKLMLLAFNGDCDAAIANVTWNNATRMEERVRRAHDAINRLGSVMTVSIDSRYRDLKLDELRLKYELEQKRQAEREEERRQREQLREEEKARREIEAARLEAESEERRYGQALEKARSEAARAEGAKLEALQARIADLETRVEAASEQKQRAISRAELTRSGHVYIISNVGSFGERVVKIGMTRRLEPLDRIKELSDASVPFDFDVHAILYSEDAPSLEGMLQAAFEEKRINLVNGRKEFFNASIDEIEEVMRSNRLTAVLTKVAEARDYRETLTRRAQREGANGAATATADTPAQARVHQMPASLLETA